MLADKRIVGQVGNFAVESVVHEVQLHDGAILRLQCVSRRALSKRRLPNIGGVLIPDQYLRALPIGGRRVRIFDVRHMARQLAEDLPSSPERDKPGLIAHHLRCAYRDKAAFVRAVGKCCEQTGIVVEPQVELPEAA
jgi:hypothetical protein